MTRPFASRECWCSPRNIGRAPHWPLAVTVTPGWGNPPLSTTKRHPMPPKPPVNPLRTTSPPFATTGPTGIGGARWHHRASVVDHLGMRPVDRDEYSDAYEVLACAKEEAEQIRRDALVTAEGIRRIALEDAHELRLSGSAADSTPAPPSRPRRSSSASSDSSARSSGSAAGSTGWKRYCSGSRPDCHPGRRAARSAKRVPLRSGRGTAARPGRSARPTRSATCVACGATGARRSAMPHSDGQPVFLARRCTTGTTRRRCPRCAGRRRERGTTWSRFSAALPQYWQRWPSRANTARRESGAVARNGTRTKCTSRITDGTGTLRRSERNSAPLRWTISAFSLSTSTTARRDDTTHSGSKLALSKSARATVVRTSLSSTHVPARPIGPGRCGPGALRWWESTVRSADLDGFARRHHSRYATRSAARGAAAAAVRGLEPEREVGRRRDREERRVAATIARASGAPWRAAVHHRSRAHEHGADRARTNTARPSVRTGSRPAHAGRVDRGFATIGTDGSVGATSDRARQDERRSPRTEVTRCTVAPRGRSTSFKDTFDALAAQVERVIRGKRRAVHLALVCLFAEGHLLIEDVPGVGKTSLAKAIAALDRRHVAPHPVHARPAALRRHRRVGLGPRPQRLRVPARRRVRQRRARRRDQPRVAEDAVGAARGDGGAPGHRRRADLPAAARRSW